MTRNLLVEIFGDEGNFAVLRLPGRKNYGVLFQADSLGGLVSDLKGVLEMLSAGELDGAEEELAAICERVEKIAASAANEAKTL